MNSGIYENSFIDIQLNNIIKTIKIKELIKYPNALIKSFNLNSNQIQFKKFSNLKQSKQNVLKLKYYKTKSFLFCHSNQFLYTINRGYIECFDLKGFDLILSTKDKINEMDLVVETFSEELTLYSLTIEDNENYFANGLLIYS